MIEMDFAVILIGSSGKWRVPGWLWFDPWWGEFVHADRRKRRRMRRWLRKERPE